MGFFKRYPIFCIVLVLLLLVLGGGIFLVLQERARVKEAENDYESALRRVQEVSRGVLYDPDTGERIAPTAANRELLKVRLDQVDADLDRIREGMAARTGKILNDSADEFTFLPKLQSFIAKQKAAAAKNQIILQTDEAFGFAKYATRAVQPQIEMIPALNRQRQVLDYILNQLIACQPSAILSVERELVEGAPTEENTRNRNRVVPDDDVFTIEELVTARANDFIDTSAFRLVFTGRTDVLRNFLNRLAEFELPLIVRSVEVRIAAEGDQPKQAEKKSKPNSEDALFALFGGSANDEEEAAPVEVVPGKEPVITENISRFTVVIEYVELSIDSKINSEEAGS